MYTEQQNSTAWQIETPEARARLNVLCLRLTTMRQPVSAMHLLWLYVRVSGFSWKGTVVHSRGLRRVA